MSLEDIIQKRKKDYKGTKINQQIKKSKMQSKPQVIKSPIVDARNKIISRKRTQITDAREKLAELAKQKDARLKLEQLRKKRNATGPPQGRHMLPKQQPFKRNFQNKERVFTDPSRQVHSQPLAKARMTVNRQLTTKRSIQNRAIDSRSLIINKRQFQENVGMWRSVNSVHKQSSYNQVGTRKTLSLKPIVRTVANDIEIDDEPMDDDIALELTRPSLNRKASLQLKIIAHNNDLRESRSSGIHRSAVVEREISPPKPPSILKKRPMAALRTEKKVEKPEKANTEYRIIVSSLGNTVTAGDIEELFGDVGGMQESRLVRPGTAEVIYKTLEDAQRAVDLYHKRQLDGQPMNCLLVTPRSNAASTRSASKPGLYSTNSNVEPDLSTFHKVLFSNF